MISFQHRRMDMKPERCTGCHADMFYPAMIVNLDGHEKERLCAECAHNLFEMIAPEFDLLQSEHGGHC